MSSYASVAVLTDALKKCPFMAKKREKNIARGARFVEMRTELRKGHERESQKSAAKAIGMSESALRNYEAGTEPTPTVRKKILAYYGCSERWLMYGEGPPFPSHDTNGGSIYSKMARDPSALMEIREATAELGGALDILMIAMHILASKTIYSAALRSNILAFNKALAQEERLDRVESEVKRLDEENRLLKASAGGAASTDPSPDAASPTGTDGQAT